MHRFFCDSSYANQTICVLSEEESHHLVHVLRIKEGEKVILFDGQGGIAEAQVIQSHSKHVQVLILSHHIEQRKSSISLAFGIPKGVAFDFIVRRSCEIGIKEFFPLQTEHSFPAKNCNLSRWQKLAIEVSKQCESNFIPQFHKPQKLEVWLEARKEKKHILFFCDEKKRENKEKKESLWLKDQGVDVCIGCEGGWSDREREEIISQNPIYLSLGKNRLRVETAALVALVLVKKQVGEID